jgi:septal ring factor EnvC (AmiA/AmiB activator)
MHQLRQGWVRSFMLSLERANLVDQEHASNPKARVADRLCYMYREICVVQEEQERNRRILAALENEKQDLASRHEQLSIMLDQTKAEAEDLAGRHAREVQRLEESLQSARQALTCAREEAAAAQAQYTEHARELTAQHEQQMQVQHASSFCPNKRTLSDAAHANDHRSPKPSKEWST